MLEQIAMTQSMYTEGDRHDFKYKGMHAPV